jgi:hypothetical protein
MKYRLLCFMLLLFISTAPGQEGNVVIRIRLIDGRNGKPIKNSEVSYELRHGYSERLARTDKSGVASVNVPAQATILIHNTDAYLLCDHDNGGLVHNNFTVAEILSTGITEMAAGSSCHKTGGTASPGDLTLFVRPWKFLEKFVI